MEHSIATLKHYTLSSAESFSWFNAVLQIGQ